MLGPVSFDRVAPRYDASRGGDKRGAEFASAIHAWLPPGPLLEVGVGTAVVAAALTALGAPVVGVDISAAMLARAYGRIGPRVARGDARHLPVRDGSVSAVVFAMALHVVGDVPAAVAEAARVLRPGGRVVALHDRPDADPSDLLDAMAPLDAYRDTSARVDGVDALVAAARAAGLRALHQGWTDRYAVGRSPNQLADEIEQRLWSYLWSFDDEQWRRHAVPAIHALRAMPEPDRVRPGRQRHRLTVFVK